MVKRAVFVVLLLASVANANPKAAAVHNKQGKAYFDAKQYDAAIGEFKKSYDLDKKPLTLFKIASAYYAKGDYENAIAFYGQYLQADPEGPYAAQALEFTTIAKKSLDDARIAKEAADAAAKKAEDERRIAQEQEKKRIEAAARVKNAQAFAQAGAWGSAGDEYRAATEIDGDPAHLLAAAEAYRKQPDLAKAAAAYRAYLDRAPTAANADDVRKELAEATRLAEEAEAKKRVAMAPPAAPRDEAPPANPPIARGISSFGPRAAFGVSQPDTNPYLMNSSDGLIFQPNVEVGAFLRYQLATQIALRPEASVVYRGGKFDGGGSMMTQLDVVDVKRAGLALALPIFFAVTPSRDGFRLGGGPFVAVMPYLDAKNKSGFPPAGDAELFDYGVFAGIEIDFGRISLEARFTKAFGKLASDVEATSYIGAIGLAFGFDR